MRSGCGRDLVGQRQDRDRRAFGREREAAREGGAQGREGDEGRDFARDGLRHEAGFGAVAVYGSAGERGLGAGHEAEGGAAARLADVLDAGDDFLSGVAALVEDDAARKFVVDGLRHEEFA